MTPWNCSDVVQTRSDVFKRFQTCLSVDGRDRLYPLALGGWGAGGGGAAGGRTVPVLRGAPGAHTLRSRVNHHYHACNPQCSQSHVIP